MNDDAKANTVEEALYQLKNGLPATDTAKGEVRAIDDFMAGVSTPTLAHLYDLIREHDGGPTLLALDGETRAMVDRLAKLRADIADHRYAGLVTQYPELGHVEAQAMGGQVITALRQTVQREVARLEAVARDCGLEPGK